MEKVLGDKKFFTGESPMYCDFMMFNALCCAKAAKEDCLDGAGSLNAFVGRMMALPGVAAYMEAEPWREIAPKDFPEGLHQPS